MSVTFPQGFVWGVAAAAHQIEGGNWNNDWWAFEHKPDTPCLEPSGDCTDSYHRYAEDIALVRSHGFGAYRFSIEWSRIEPEDGEFSVAALDYYRRMLAECHSQGVQPVVTFHHFSNPRWLAALAVGRRPRSSTASPGIASEPSHTSAISSRSAARSTSRTSCR